MHGAAVDPLVTNLTVFVLSIFVGYHVVWNVTPALHTPVNRKGLLAELEDVRGSGLGAMGLRHG